MISLDLLWHTLTRVYVYLSKSLSSSTAGRKLGVDIHVDPGQGNEKELRTPFYKERSEKEGVEEKQKKVEEEAEENNREKKNRFCPLSGLH